MGPKPKRVALYLRVSTDGQTTENQRRELVGVAEHRGWVVTETYEDAGISGAEGRDGRPAFNRLCQDATRRRFDIIAAWSVDRLGRSLQHLVAFLAEVHAAGVHLYMHQQAVDTTTPGGRALFQMMGVFAEFERAMIRDRVNAGLARARAAGKRLGRRPISSKTIAKIAEAAGDGLSVRAIANKAGASVGTVHRVIRGRHVSQSPTQ
jgi:DNA invertase Pin-like site-specific DNA recombinase